MTNKMYSINLICCHMKVRIHCGGLQIKRMLRIKIQNRKQRSRNHNFVMQHQNMNLKALQNTQKNLKMRIKLKKKLSKPIIMPTMIYQIPMHLNQMMKMKVQKKKKQPMQKMMKVRHQRTCLTQWIWKAPTASFSRRPIQVILQRLKPNQQAVNAKEMTQMI